jgi:hypothetical protein
MCPVHVKEMARKRNNPAQNLSFRKLATKNTQVVTTLIKTPKFDFQERKKWLSLPKSYIYSKFIPKNFVAVSDLDRPMHKSLLVYVAQLVHRRIKHN